MRETVEPLTDCRKGHNTGERPRRTEVGVLCYVAEGEVERLVTVESGDESDKMRSDIGPLPLFHSAL